MTAQVTVLYFAKSAELSGIKSEVLSVPQQLTSLQLWQEIVNEHPRYTSSWEISFCSSSQATRLLSSPPSAGASSWLTYAVTMCELEDQPKDLIKVTYEKLSTDEVAESVKSPSCGAVSMFIGTTRNHFEGKKVVRLEYEAYIPMAEAEIKKICRGIRNRWPAIHHINIHHRLGLVNVTEASVIIAISGPHRNESLEAVKYCIDTLKATVPIWKKEIYDNEEYIWKENKECQWAKNN
ncbi:molybdopterin synthase catalytic subunit-like isoform X1 [Leucoraja erinacea]|uniref:molybdopterin synthase catalytic subunit-like isoform X1 n=2 Tax=Leucoraja erinaceus TaxID=7782 RepID=UPI0024579699|nr:molybdopterin synthase catalytic subunit-like isoform X1 [Leucoraja erinacea]